MGNLVVFDTNRHIKGSYHQQKYQEKRNLESFISIIQSSQFKDHKDYNQISNFFQPSIEIIAKEILDDLNENGLNRKDRLEQLLNDLKNIVSIYKDICGSFDLSNIEYFSKSIRKNIMSNPPNLELAKGDIANLLQAYRLKEKSIISHIIAQMAELVSKNYTFLLFDFWYQDDGAIDQRNVTEQKIEKYFDLLLVILMNKGITKQEIVKLFEKLCSFCNYSPFVNRDQIHFRCEYPLDLENTFETLAEFRFQIMNIVNNLTIKERFDRFMALLYEEKNCYYIFHILNTELNGSNEVEYGNVSYYNEQINKSKGFRSQPELNESDKFGSGREVKAIIPFKTKRYFSNMSALKVKKIIENNTSLLKLFVHNHSNEKENYFKPSPSKMDVSYSHIVLDEDLYVLSSMNTVYDGDVAFRSNIIYDSIYTNEEYQKKLNSFIAHLNYKQVENNLTGNDCLVLQSLQKFKLSVEATSYSDLLLYTWNGFEYLIKGFKDEINKLETIQDIVVLVYKFIYSNTHHRWDLTDKKAINEINQRAKRLVIYGYTYRNKLVHSHLSEDSFMISVSKGMNIIFKSFLSLMIDKIIVDPDFNMDDIVNQLNSDLQKQIAELKKSK